MIECMFRSVHHPNDYSFERALRPVIRGQHENELTTLKKKSKKELKVIVPKAITIW